MSDGNGRIPLIGHRPAMKKDSDLCTMAEARKIAADEATKVHEFYLQQIPQFTARMIQDALIGFGLIALSDEAKLAATQPPDAAGAPDAGGAGGDPQPEIVGVTEDALLGHGLVAEQTAPDVMPTNYIGSGHPLPPVVAPDAGEGDEVGNAP